MVYFLLGFGIFSMIKVIFSDLPNLIFIITGIGFGVGYDQRQSK